MYVENIYLSVKVLFNFRLYCTVWYYEGVGPPSQPIFVMLTHYGIVLGTTQKCKFFSINN